MKMKNTIFLSLALVLFISGPANCRTITVRLDDTGDYTNIQAAINDSNDGDVVIGAPGTYTGEGNRDIDFKGKAIIVRSKSGSEDCIIDCNGSEAEPHQGFYFHSGEDGNSVLNGFTITNGYAEGWSGIGGGGAIYCYGSGPKIINCTITGNSAGGGGGGGILCNAGGYSPLTITNCTIIGNSAGYGGGIASYCSDLSISNCTISGNTAEGQPLGGAGSGGVGGGILCGPQPGSHSTQPCGSVEMTDCIITENAANKNAGGVALGSTTAAVVTNCTISGNTANEDGGGIFCVSSVNETTITNCKISGNAAGEYGGGIYSVRGSGYTKTPPTISNCTVVDNRADYAGGGIYVRAGGIDGPTINNCILWGNAAPDGPELGLGSSYTTVTVVTVGYSDVQGGQAAAYIEPGCTLNWGTGNIDTDPLFVQPGYWDANGTADDANDDFWVDGDYHLFKGSECIDAGTNNPAGGLPVTDLDGKLRPFDGDGDGTAIADMGAYEYPVVSRKPVIRVEPRKFELFAEHGGAGPEPQVLQISNLGVRPLHWEIIEDCNWLETMPTKGTLTDGVDEVILMVDSNSLAIGGYSCILKVCEPRCYQ